LFSVSLPILIYLGRSTFRTFHLHICLAKLFPIALYHTSTQQRPNSIQPIPIERSK
jgi:hypothetical protein